MFYKVKVRDHVRVPPSMFGHGKHDAVLKNIKERYSGYTSKELGFVINVLDIEEIKEGIIIAGDGAAYYETIFNLLAYRPELNEVVWGKVRDITDFGAFLQIGPTEGMVHISQSMDDFVGFNKEKVLQGKKSGKMLRIGDKCKARVVAVSFKDLANPKIGLTMRQEGLGRLEWLEPKGEEKAEGGKEGKKEK